MRPDSVQEVGLGVPRLDCKMELHLGPSQLPFFAIKHQNYYCGE